MKNASIKIFIFIFVLFLFFFVKSETASMAGAITCKDSDGKNYYVKGEVMSMGGSAIDQCLSGTDILYEYFCENNTLGYVKYTCTQGCYDGACLGTPVNEEKVIIFPPQNNEQSQQNNPSATTTKINILLKNIIENNASSTANLPKIIQFNPDNYAEISNLLLSNKPENIQSIIASIKQEKNENLEKEIENKFIKKIISQNKPIGQNVRNALNNFIAYGVDPNSAKLGAGERAAVIYSYKEAYGKLPENQEELTDIIKIANGRWPGIQNNEAEKKAKEIFKNIYKRIPDMDNPRDNAAVTIMAYGLRQKAENRNLNSETQGIKTFRALFGHNPESTGEWNIMQAITYSGASRMVDTDKDFLPDAWEIKIGTDPKNPDTDNDKHLDGIEVLNGHDPKK